ncbi:hypothetical protein [Polyangium fumosum]|uniref:Uncharacterized protein n=1 Tax=Polyangium fumosum TaxID=889272 RepID=A0A4U1I5L0_9BACT|nr:hypothetical protein [Polyangium fumosum]TKC88631.1 hypothetical protein E8A74_51520 [Polyangium fumosum]
MPAGSGGSGAAGGGGGAGGSNADPCAKPWPDATNTGIPAGTPALAVIDNDLHTESPRTTPPCGGATHTPALE